MERKPSILVADVDTESSILCRRIAEVLDCELVTASSQDSVLRELSKNEIAVAFLDADTICDSIGLLRELKQKSARIEVLIAHEHATIPGAVEAIKAGATDYLQKPLQVDVVERILTSAFERYRGFQLPTLDELERQAIDLALSHAEGNRIEAARLLSIGKTTLYRKLREYGEHAPRRRRGNGAHAM
jgi:DNA-binding NtrC family response regulator